MLTFLKLLRGMLKAITSSAAPWQIALGAFLGVLLGFLPIFPLSEGPSPLGFALILAALVINCHLASVLLFMGVGKLLGLALLDPAVALGGACTGLAQASADIPFLHYSHWSHTGYLGLTLIGLGAAPLVAAGMWGFTLWFRATVQARLAQQKLLATTGKVVGNSVVFKTLCWFIGLK
jgi:hypothetical protein